MRQRLLNPQKLKINLELLPIKNIEGVDFRTLEKTYKNVDSGMCQCFKDCDCYLNRGKVTIIEITWYRNVKFDGTNKCFYSEPYTQKEYVC